MQNQAEGGEQDNAYGSPEGASAAESEGRPGSGDHSPQAGAVHSGHGTCAGAAGWPREPSGAGEIRKAGNEGAAPRAGAQARREALKKEAGRRRGGTQQRRRDPLSAPGLPAGPPRRGPPAASEPPNPGLPLEDWFLSSAPLPEAPPHRSASPPAHDVILRTLAPGKERLAGTGWQTSQELGARPGAEPTGS